MTLLPSSPVTTSLQRLLRMETIPATDLVPIAGKILCCECGTPIDPNPANLCVACLRIKVDITEGIPKNVGVFVVAKLLKFHINVLTGDDSVLQIL